MCLQESSRERHIQREQYQRYYRWLKKEGGIHHPTHMETYLEPEQVRRLKWIKKQCEGTNDILEVGCSAGYIIEMVNGKYGMDKEPFIIEANIQRNPKIQWLLHDGTTPWQMFKDNSVEIVGVFDVLEHCNWTGALRMLNEALRVAKTKVLITIPNGLDAPEKNFRNACCFKHKWVCTQQRLKKLMKHMAKYVVTVEFDPAFILIEVEK
jgi:predicted SAM-dependent methyltransferase